MVNFKLGEEMRNDVDQNVMSIGQRKNQSPWQELSV